MDDFTRDRYYKLNIILLRALGLWPFKTTPLTSVKVISVHILLLSGLIVKLASFVKIKFELYDVLRNICESVMFVTFVLKYTVFSSQRKALGELVLQIQRDWDNLRDANEIKIFQVHASVAQFHAKIFAIFSYLAISVCIMGQLGLHYLYTVMPRETPITNAILLLEYFIDQEKYFYLIVFHVALVLVVGMTVFVSTEAICVMLFQHVLALINVASYQMEEAVNVKSLNMLRSEQSFSSYKRMVIAVDTQLNALRFFEYSLSIYLLYYFILLLLAMIFLTTTFFRFSHGVSVSRDLSEILISALLLTGQIGILFYINYMAQKLIDSDSNFYRVTYDMNWYDTELPNQKLLVFILQRGSKPLTIDVYGVYKPSIASFSSYVKLSWTYFMMFNSLQ